MCFGDCTCSCQVNVILRSPPRLAACSSLRVSSEILDHALHCSSAFCEPSGYEHVLTASASGFTPFSIIDTQYVSCCLSKPVFLWRIVRKRDYHQNRRGASMGQTRTSSTEISSRISSVSRAAARFASTLEVFCEDISMFVVKTLTFGRRVCYLER